MQLLVGDVMETARTIAAFLERHDEWFCEDDCERQSVSLRRDEWSCSAAHNRLIFSHWSERGGTRVWTITAWQIVGAQLFMRGTRRATRERATLKLTPRASVADEIEMLQTARRRALADYVARIGAAFPAAQIARVHLSRGAPGSKVPGRYARISLTEARCQGMTFLTGAVDGAGERNIEAFLSAALLWFMRGSARLKSSLSGTELALVLTTPDDAEAAARLIAFLRERWRQTIKLYLMRPNEDRAPLAPIRSLAPIDVYAARPHLTIHQPRAPQKHANYTDVSNAAATDLARDLTALAPEAIDVVGARSGATLRYHGLPFARIRRLAGRESAWYGVDARRAQPLTAETWPALKNLLADLNIHRAPYGEHRHAFYTASAEAWLESLLRRDITRLDPGMVAAPLYAQFRGRAGDANLRSRPVDLFALRQDGRFVLIELKVAEDRNMVLQGVDYWWRIEALRRRGAIDGARLFGARLVDAPTLLYFVAPLLSYHRSFGTLARSVAPEVEIYRYDLNEDWRAGVRVLRRARANEI